MVPWFHASESYVQSTVSIPDTIPDIRLCYSSVYEVFPNVLFRLIKHTVEGIRTKLDRIYLQELKSISEPTNGHDLNGQEIIDLQEELESLYSEILPVAQMSAEQQYLQPALREIATRGGRGKERSVEAVKYVCYP